MKGRTKINRDLFCGFGFFSYLCSRKEKIMIMRTKLITQQLQLQATRTLAAQSPGINTSPTLSCKRLLRIAVVLFALAWSTNILAGNVNVATWSALQNALNSNNTITLTANITAGASEVYLNVPEGVTVILNLNGKTINRGLGSNTEGIVDGLVIKNLGTLTINGSGTITGGNSLGEGGGINNKGTLNLNNVNVTNNKSAQHGGGIRNQFGTLNITGGSITGNISGYNMSNYGNGGGIFSAGSLSITGVVIQNNTCGIDGGGLYLYTNNSATLTISGSNTITENIRLGGSISNVYLRSGTEIAVDGNINNSIIGVHVQTHGVFTSGLSGKGTAANFTSDDPTYTITLNGDGEAQTELIDNWTTLKKAMAAGGNIKLAGDCTDPSPSSTSYLNVPSGKTVTLDLWGQTINRNLSTATPNGFVIYNSGTLTIMDTNNVSGYITGGNNTASGGGIYNIGTLTINNGTITNNKAGSDGGGIFNASNGTISITSGSKRVDIINNTSNTKGGGIYSQGTLNISDYVTIKDNKKGSADNNVELASNKYLTISGTLNYLTYIGLYASSAKTFTSGLTSSGNISNKSCFKSDNTALEVCLHNEEIRLKNKITPSISMTDWTYDGTGHNPTVTGNTGSGAETFTYSSSSSNYYTYTSTAPVNAGSYKVKVSIAETADYAAGKATSSVYTISQKEASISWSNTLFTYNGTAQKPTATVSNRVGNDVCTVTVSGEQTDASSSAYTATATELSNANYKLPTTPPTHSFKINKASLTITANDNAITYGDPPTGNGVIYSGLVNNETASVLGGSLGYTFSYAQYGIVGDNYIIVPNGLTSNNYSITFLPGTLTVAQKEATLSWTNTALTYNGTAQKPTAAVSNLVNNDYCIVEVSGEQTNASATAYTATATALNNTNYKLPAADEDKQTSFTISPKGITVSGITASDKTYDGTTTATVSTAGATLAGKVDGDDLTISATGAFADANAGNQTVIINLGSLGGASVGNYALTATGQQTTTATISQAPLTITAKDNAITYGNLPTGNGVTYSGFVNGETETTADLTGSLRYTFSYAQYGDVGDNYTITPNGLTSNNYNINFVDGTLTVAKKEATLSWTNTALTYNGTAQKPTAAVSNLVNNDACTVTVSGEQTNASATAYTATATELSNGNYKLPATDANKQTSFTIGKAPLTITARNHSITYGEDGANDGVTYSGFVNGETEATSDLADELTYTYCNKSTDALYLAGSDVGDDYWITPNGLTSNNYAITFVQGTLTVEPKTLTITAKDQAIEFGTAIAKGTDQVTLNPDLFADDALTRITLTPSTEDFTNDGTATIMPSGAEIKRDGVVKTSNYDITYEPGTLRTTKSVEGGMPYVVKTFYDASWKTSDGETAYLPLSYTPGSSEVTLTPLQGAPKGKPVIFGKATEDPEDPDLSNPFYLASVSDASEDPTEVTAATIRTDYDNAVKAMDKLHFAITDGTKKLQAVIEEVLAERAPVSDAIVMILTGGRFRAVDISTGDLEKYAKEGLLLFILSKWEYMNIGSNAGGGSANSRGIGIGDGGATSLTPIPSPTGEGSGASWYDLQGRRIAQPARKGVYIHNGKKVVIK